MTPTERRQLIEKRRRGTLTDAENQQYQELLRTDSSFYQDVDMHTRLTDLIRQETDKELWEAVGKARAKDRKRTSALEVVGRYPYAYAMAACVALLLAGYWLYRFPKAEDGAPQLVKAEKRSVYLVTDSARLGYDNYAGSVWLQWRQNKEQKIPQTYTFCRDTLRIFLQNSQDTTTWKTVGLRFDAEQQIVYISRPSQPLLPLLECTKEPQPISP